MDTQTQIVEFISGRLNVSAGAAMAILVASSVWTMIWKGIALWKAARLSHKGWFVALLVVNTVGLLEMLYIFLVARKYEVEVVEKQG